MIEPEQVDWSAKYTDFHPAITFCKTATSVVDTSPIDGAMTALPSRVLPLDNVLGATSIVRDLPNNIRVEFAA